MATALENFLKLLAAGKDGALLRFGLGSEYLKTAQAAEAVPHLRRAVQFDPDYSAAWKLLGRALADSGDIEAAREAYSTGILVAERRGDQQAAREMRVFEKRLDKPSAR